MIKKILLYGLLFLIFLGPAWQLYSDGKYLSLNWRTAPRVSSNIAPKPQNFSPAVVQVYAARTYGWRGAFAVHTWIATKAKNAATYTTYQVIGWRMFWGVPVLAITKDIPDRYWFGRKPSIISSIVGPAAERLIPKVDAVAKSYPYQKQYVFWPGPNSNTFTAYVVRNVPELHFALPVLAIGKDFLGYFTFFAKAPSNTGYQISLLGLFGLLIAREEGLEINILGLIIGFHPINLTVAWPGVGSVRI